MTNSASKKTYLPVFIILVLSALVYINILPNGFVHDDSDQIINNPWITDFAYLPGAFFSSAWAFLEEEVTSNYYRPVMHLVYTVDYAIFELDPWGYHLTSIIINSINSVLVFFLLNILLIGEGKGDEVGAEEISFIGHDPAGLAAFFGALVFSVHPIHTESVAWAAGIPELTFTFFFLLSFYFYIRFRRGASPILFVASLVSFFFSTLCKEPALALPMVLVCYDFFVRREKVFPLVPWLLRFVPFGAVGILYLFLRVYSLQGFAPRGGAHELTTFGNILNIFPLVFDYFSKLVLPLNLNFFYTFKPVHSITEARALLSIVFALVVLFILWRTYKISRLTLFSILFILMPLLPVLYIPAVGRNTFAERYLYLPSFGAVLILSVCIRAAISKSSGEARRAFKSIIVGIVILVIAGGVLTVKRNYAYKDNFALWFDTIKKSPDNGFVRLNLGIEYAANGDDDTAIKYYHAALESLYLTVDATLTYYNLGNALTRKGKLDDAASAFERAIELDKEYYRAYNNLGTVYAMKAGRAVTASDNMLAREKRCRLILIAVLVLVSIGLYVNTLTSEFVSDDLSAILNNEWIRDVNNIPNFFFRSLWSFLPDEVYSNYYRPFENLFFMLGRMISGKASFGHHILNIALHTMSGVLVFLISSVLIEGPNGKWRGEGIAPFLSFLAAILFIANPVNTEAVAWASAVSELSFAFFFLLALYLFMRERFYLSALFFLCSVFSKETGLVFIFFAVAYDLVIRRERIFPLKAWVARYWPFAVLFFLYAAMRYNAIGGIVPYETAHRELTSFQYFLNILPLTAEFLKNLVYPFNLIFFHYGRLDFIHSFFEIWNIIYLALFIIWLYILKLLWRREPALFYSLIWIVIPLFPIFYLGWNQGEPTYADRFIYVPNAGFAISVALIVGAIIRRSRARGSGKSTVLIIKIIFLVVVVAFSIGTLKRNIVWQTGLTLWEDSARKSPENANARLSYASQLSRAGLFKEAVIEFGLIVKGMPENAEAHNGLGVAYAQLGNIDAAIDEFRLALRLKPDFGMARVNLERAEAMAR
jgi:Flp pilus assembly protein TadD